MYEWAEEGRPKSWTAIEAEYLRALEALDDNLVSGEADMGDLQNGKGDFFNDLLALILEGCAGVDTYSRRLVPGFIFPTHNLDITYPAAGVAKFLAEAKAVGTPKHPGSPKEGRLGREGSADLRKRVTELAFKTIDLKAEHGRIEAMRGERPVVNPGGNLTTWLRSVSPKTYLFISARVISRADFAAVVAYGGRAAQVEDGVGVFCYEPISEVSPTRYRSLRGIPTEFELDRALFRACEDLTVIAQQEVIPLPTEVVQEAVEMEELTEEHESEP
jgi:hypothetical protein